MYATGLLSDGERKSMEPIAARLCGDETKANATHHKLIHFLGTTAWSGAPIRRIAADYAISAMETQDPISSWVVDDTGFIKSGKFSPGVQRQYTGSAGKRTNCQIGVSIVVAKDANGKDTAIQWLLIEWPVGEPDPTHYVLSTLPKKTSLKDMVNAVKNRWRVEQSYRDLKGQLGLDHYEGRTFIGWHHHISVALACYAFLVAERVRSFSPSASGSRRNSALEYAA